MKNLKAMMSCVLVAAMLTGVAACGQKQQAEPETEAPVQEEETDVQEEPEAQEVPAEEPKEEASETEIPAEAGGRTLVVYYSATGSTKSVAGYLAAVANGETFEIVPAEPYSSEDLNWTDENSRVVYEHDNPDAREMELVEAVAADWEAYDTVFIGYPKMEQGFKSVSCA